MQLLFETAGPNICQQARVFCLEWSQSHWCHGRFHQQQDDPKEFNLGAFWLKIAACTASHLNGFLSALHGSSCGSDGNKLAVHLQVMRPGFTVAFASLASKAAGIRICCLEQLGCFVMKANKPKHQRLMALKSGLEKPSVNIFTSQK